MLIEIKGVQFSNKGAELMLHAIIQEIKSRWPNAEICLVPNKNSPYGKRAKLGAFQKVTLRKNILDLSGLYYLVPKKIRTIFKEKWGIVTEADIDVVLDASGFTYGDQWNNLMLKQTAIEVCRLRRKTKHYIFMPQALGPFSNQANQKSANSAFSNASLVFARDKKSFNYVKGVDSTLLVEKAPDFTNLLVPTLDQRYEYLRNAVAVVPNSKMLSEKNNSQAWRDNYIKILIETINILASLKLNVFLLNHEGEADHLLCAEINQHLMHPIDIVSPDDSLQVKAIIGQCKLVVCSRYHGCVSALSQQVPCIATSWSHKYEELYDDYHQLALLMSADVMGESLQQFIHTVVKGLAETKRSLIKPATDYKVASLKMWQTIDDYIVQNNNSI